MAQEEHVLEEELEKEVRGVTAALKRFVRTIKPAAVNKAGEVGK